jgi:hypothetical protein
MVEHGTASHLYLEAVVQDAQEVHSVVRPGRLETTSGIFVANK